MPASTIACTSPIVAHATPTAPASMASWARRGVLWVLTCGRSPRGHAREGLGHRRDVLLDEVEVDDERRGGQLGDGHPGGQAE